MNELTWASLSREDLVTLVRARDATIAALQRRISLLEQRLTERDGGGMPGNKPVPTTPKRPPKPRKKRANGFGRARLTPTQAVTHAVDHCPTCGTRLVGGWVQRTREVIEIPIGPVQVTEHRYLARECPLCRTRHAPPVELRGVVGDARQRLGINLLSLITTLREDGRLPFATIQWYLETVHHLHVSVGELVAVTQQVARHAEALVEDIRTTLQASPVVGGDETGWREHGVNGYVWTFWTPTERYFVRRGRGKEVVDEVLGTEGGATLVSDFYAAYHHYPGVKQRCWAHLLREVHDLCEVYPTDAGLADWAAVVLALYREATAFSHPAEPPRLAKQREMEQRLWAACQPFCDDPLAVQAKVCRRIERHLPELFVFVADPAVPPTNNAAERSLRHLVTSRKISGGTQSPRGTATKMTLASLFGTWRARGVNPFYACRDLLQSPHH